MPKPPSQYITDKKEYEFIYSVFLSAEKRAWEKWRKILVINREWKNLPKHVKSTFRFTHMLGYCEGANIPMLDDYLNLKETERSNVLS